MKSIYLKELRQRFRSELSAGYPSLEIDAIFYELIAHYCGLPRTVLAMEPDRQLQTGEAADMIKALEELKAHRPVQHIIGQAFFMDMTLRVSPDVLIPRPETAELVTWITEEFSTNTDKPVVLDAGTGSGCIALGLKKYLPHAEIYGMDISDAALRVARYNSITQNLEVQFYKGDIGSPDSGPCSFDILVSNPPYIPKKESETLQAHVRCSEPHLALFVPDEDPLINYRYLCNYAARNLRNGGWMYLETHQDYAYPVLELLKVHGFSAVEIKKDIFGKDRFVRGKYHATPGNTNIL